MFDSVLMIKNLKDRPVSSVFACFTKIEGPESSNNTLFVCFFGLMYPETKAISHTLVVYIGLMCDFKLKNMVHKEYHPDLYPNVQKACCDWANRHISIRLFELEQLTISPETHSIFPFKIKSIPLPPF